MQRTGSAYLPLHGGRAPRWLFTRMADLAGVISDIIVEEEGETALLERISDPYWFQAFSCVLGYDWHSSGTTTVTMAALRQGFRDKGLEMTVAGGKGIWSKKAPEMIEKAADWMDLSEEDVQGLQYASRMTAKVDNALLQDGFDLYHHAFVLTGKGDWAVIQQGMSDTAGYARRYHWSSNTTDRFVVEPHSGIAGPGSSESTVLDMTSTGSDGARRTTVDMIGDGIDKLRREYSSILSPGQMSLDRWSEDTMNDVPVSADRAGSGLDLTELRMPRKVNWRALRELNAIGPGEYEQVAAFPGIGPGTIRALTLISELVYGAPAMWSDPVRHSFAFGGKDGVPYPVDRKRMDRAVIELEGALDEARLGNAEKMKAVARLKDVFSEERTRRSGAGIMLKPSGRRFSGLA